jgi:hypothetical protein|tara:strand:- start:1040 stop:1354 length:315 start_codon:yes stop_codon:yes gene_type:complete
MKTFCPHCGNKMEYVGKKPNFCSSCGKPLSLTQQAEEPQEIEEIQQAEVIEEEIEDDINIDVNNLSISKLDFDCNYEKKQPINLGALMQNNKSSEQGPKDLTQE